MRSLAVDALLVLLFCASALMVGASINYIVPLGL